MFESLDEQSSERLPASSGWGDPAYRFDFFLAGVLVAGGAVIRDTLARGAHLLIILGAGIAAAGAGGWLAYRYVRRIRPAWQSNPSLRLDLVLGTVLGLLLAALYIDTQWLDGNESTATGLVLTVLVVGAWYLRRFINRGRQ